MTKKHPRDIGAEILEGIREIKKGVVGRGTTFPPVVAVSPEPDEKGQAESS